MTRRLALLAIYPLLWLAAGYALLRYGTALWVSPAKALDIAFQLDETANMATNGQRNTTISGRAARARDAGRHWGCLLCRVLDAIDPHHCSRVRDAEAARGHH